jgi:hypothetical protein
LDLDLIVDAGVEVIHGALLIAGQVGAGVRARRP